MYIVKIKDFLLDVVSVQMITFTQLFDDNRCMYNLELCLKLELQTTIASVEY